MRGTAIHAAAQGITLAAGFVVVAVLGRALGTEVYGYYCLVISVLVAVELIGRLGIPQATAKLVAEVRNESPDGPRAYEQTSITLTAITFLSIGAAFFAAAPLLARAFDVPDGVALFRLASIDIPFYGMFFCLQHVLNGQRRFASEGLGVALYGSSKALGVVALLAVGVTIERALIVNALASVAGCAYFATRISGSKFVPTLREAGPIVRIALPTALFILGAQLIVNLDFWLLKLIGRDVPPEAIGLYGAATNIARLPQVAHFVMMAVMIPTVSRANSTGDTGTVRSLVRGAVRFLILALVPACAYLAVRSEPLMHLIMSGEYDDAAPFQSVLVVRYGLLGVLLMTLCSVLLALGHPRQAARQLLQLVPVGVVLNVVLIDARGAEGAALAAVATVLIGLLLAAAAVRAHIGPLLDFGATARAVVATAAVVAPLLLWQLPPLLFLVELPLAAAAYLALLVLLRAVTLDELRQLAQNPLRRR